MDYFTNLNKLAEEICKREKSTGREVNITDVKRVIRHLSEIIYYEWQLNFGLTLTAKLRQVGRTHYDKTTRDENLRS